ncbi:MAG: RluA family pseudouridine synthase [Saprospiraceae bacterium]|nr:RluA family pseudouridine synthase [Saprospiraceae bacterium]
MVSPQVIFEDNHLLGLNKPAGMLVHEDSTGDATLEDWGKSYIAHQYNKKGNVFLTPCHRLDRPVSGVCLFARTSKSLPRVQELFRLRQVKKVYYAVVSTRPEQLQGTLEHYIDKGEAGQPVKALSRPSRRHPKAKHATLRYELAAEMDQLFMLRVEPDTGRPHQIRAQLAAAGMPIRCDLKYGAKLKPDFGGIYLHAWSLSFIHPVKKEMVTMTADPPNTVLWKKLAGFMESTGVEY